MDKDYDVEICGECHGYGVCYSGGWFHKDITKYRCPNCKDSPRPGYIIIPKPEFRPDEKE